MLTYQNLIETASAFAEIENIKKEGLILTYELDEENHKKLDEDLFYRTKQHENGVKFVHREIIEVTIGEINFKIKKKNLEDN
jgi:hypothetical protein